MRKLLTFLIAVAVMVGVSTSAFAQLPIRAFPPGMFQNRAALDASSGGGSTVVIDTSAKRRRNW